jgi:hypothetical protein
MSTAPRTLGALSHDLHATALDSAAANQVTGRATLIVAHPGGIVREVGQCLARVGTLRI